MLKLIVGVFTIVLRNERFAQLEYIFVIPKYRRKGIFKDYLKYMMTNVNCVTLTTSNSPVVRCVIPLGFKNMGKALSGNELYYRWERDGSVYPERKTRAEYESRRR